MHWALSRRIQITVAFSAITLVAIFLLLPADTDIQTTKTSPIHDAIPQFDSNAKINLQMSHASIFQAYDLQQLISIRHSNTSCYCSLIRIDMCFII